MKNTAHALCNIFTVHRHYKKKMFFHSPLLSDPLCQKMKVLVSFPCLAPELWRKMFT